LRGLSLQAAPVPFGETLLRVAGQHQKRHFVSVERVVDSLGCVFGVGHGVGAYAVISILRLHLGQVSRPVFMAGLI
jgi:hypothetical protein